MKLYSLVLVMILSACLIVGFPGYVTAYDGGGEILITVDGRVISPGASPYIQNGRTMVPFRFIAEALGCKVGWDDEWQSVRAERNGQVVYLYIGDSVMLVNGIVRELDAAAVIKEGRTFVPLRAVSDAMGFKVDWEQNSNTVVIKSPPSVAKAVVSAEGAAISVKNLPGVKELFSNSSSGDIRLELSEEDEAHYVFRVYEIVKDGDMSHTATYGWYTVEKGTGRAYSITP